MPEQNHCGLILSGLRPAYLQKRAKSNNSTWTKLEANKQAFERRVTLYWRV